MKAALENPVADAPVSEVLERLRQQLANAENRVRQQPFEIHPVLAQALGQPGLKPGAAYVLDSAGVLLQALMAQPSQQGHWCGVIGLPTFATESAAALGVRLERLVLVPEPGEQWLLATATLAEVVPVLALRPPGRVREADAARLGSRLRDRGGVLLVVGDWPRAEARLTLRQPQWHGLGDGYGYLQRRQVRIEVSTRHRRDGHGLDVVLPTIDGGLALPTQEPVRLRVAG